MIDLRLYERIRLRKRPSFQRLVADGFLRYDYRNVAIRVEGQLPPAPVIIAMNHTDNFNYWPFQFHFHRTERRYTATWVKGKNYEHPFVSGFMRLSNTIPLASRGYLISRDFIGICRRRPTQSEYRSLRDGVEQDVQSIRGVPAAVLNTPRSLFGYRFNPEHESYARAIDTAFRLLMAQFVRLNEEAYARGIDLLVFPQGSRSIRLSKGRSGLAQIALHLGATIVPVGCSGSPTVYPGKSFRAQPGRVTYRIGNPITLTEYAGDMADTPFVPFSRRAETKHHAAFSGMVDHVMQRINDLLDDEYRFNPGEESDGTRDVNRFV